MTHRSTIVLAGLLATLSFRPVHAQTFAIDRGVWQLSGSAGLSSSSSGGTRRTSISLSPYAGYFVRRGFEVKIGLPLSYASWSGVHQWWYGVSSGVAFYLGGPAQHVYPYVSVGGGLSWSWSENSGALPQYRSTVKTHTWSLSGAIGLASMIARNFALTSEAYYDSSWYSGTSSVPGTRSSTFGLHFGIAAFVF